AATTAIASSMIRVAPRSVGLQNGVRWKPIFMCPPHPATAWRRGRTAGARSDLVRYGAGLGPVNHIRGESYRPRRALEAPLGCRARSLGASVRRPHDPRESRADGISRGDLSRQPEVR